MFYQALSTCPPWLISWTYSNKCKYLKKNTFYSLAFVNLYFTTSEEEEFHTLTIFLIEWQCWVSTNEETKKRSILNEVYFVLHQCLHSKTGQLFLVEFEVKRQIALHILLDFESIKSQVVRSINCENPHLIDILNTFKYRIFALLIPVEISYRRHAHQLMFSLCFNAIKY